MKKVDWEGFFSELNEQERDAIIIITLNRIIEWISVHDNEIDYERTARRDTADGK